MDFVLAKAVDFSFFEDAKHYVAGSNHYFVKANQDRLRSVIDDLMDSVEDEDGEERPHYADRAELMREQGAYELVCSEDKDFNNSHYRNTHWLPSELEIVSTDPEGILNLQYVNVWHGGYLGGYDELGSVFRGIKPKNEYTQYYILYLPERGVQFVERQYLAVAKEGYQKPAIILGKVNAALVHVEGSEQIVVRLLKTGANMYELLDGNRAGQRLRSSDITLCPDDEKEREKWARFVVKPRVLEAAPATKAILMSMQDTVARYITPLMQPLDVQRHQNNCYRFLPNGPDYIKADEKDTTKVSFLPTSKVARVLEKGENPYESTSRVTVSWAKFAAALLLPGIVSLGHIEVFHNSISALCATEFGPEDTKPELLIVRGEEIAKYYNYETYTMPKQGELWSSCMRSVPAGYFGIYVENPDQVGLLISRDRKSGKIYGRGLVWTTPMGTFLDRVYSNTQIEQKRMQVWAEKNGYVDIWNGRRGSYPDEISVQLDSPYHQYYPYMDSMAYLNPTTGLLSNKHTSGRHEIRSTGGDRNIASGEVNCAASQRIAPKTKMKATVSGKYALEKYLKELRTGGLEVEQNVVQDQLVGGYISSAQSIKVRVEGSLKTTLQSNPDFVYITKYGTFYPKDQCAYSVLDKGFVVKSEAVEMPDGTFVSSDRADTYRRLLLRRQPNRARIDAPVAAPKVAVAEELFA